MSKLLFPIAAVICLMPAALWAGLPGDANGDGVVDMADYSAWCNNYTKTGATLADGDFDGSGVVDMSDYAMWFNNYGRSVNSSYPVGEPVLELPTLQCLGVYWIIKYDQNQNASIGVQYRLSGATAWTDAYPLFRVEKNPIHDGSGHVNALTVPADCWLFAGSIVNLSPDTAYDIQLTLSDTDGGGTSRILSARTLAEPIASASLPTYHVVPGSGGGSGSLADPYRGLSAAQAAASAGKIFLVHAGTYSGTFLISKNGSAGLPIVWRGAGDGDAVLVPTNPGNNCIEAFGRKYVYIENLVLQNGSCGVKANDAADIVVSRCRMTNVQYGFWCTTNNNDASKRIFISDNTMTGPCTWPRSQGIENQRGVQITGAGHVVCYNRISHFADGIDTYQSSRNEAIDFHNNEVSECTDDGAEMDYSQRNTRNFNNRYTNIYQGISEQPIYGGPVYIFRNAMYNVCQETFKMHNNPSGALFFHNTSVKQGMPLLLNTSAPAYNSVQKNNLFIGSTGVAYGYENTSTMYNCDYDYDGWGGTWTYFLKWNGVRYSTIAAAKASAPVYKHALAVPGVPFASGVTVPANPNTAYPTSVNDLRLKTVTPAIDGGTILRNFSAGYVGAAPDLGAYELGSSLPQYGPRPIGGGAAPAKALTPAKAPSPAKTVRPLSKNTLR